MRELAVIFVVAWVVAATSAQTVAAGIMLLGGLCLIFVTWRLVRVTHDLEELAEQQRKASGVMRAVANDVTSGLNGDG